PGQETLISASSSGILHFSKKDLAVGAAIGQGERLAVISSQNLAEGDTYAKVQSQYELAKTDWERAQQLIQEQLISQRAYNEAKAAYEQASIAHRALAGSAGTGGIAVNSSM